MKLRNRCKGTTTVRGVDILPGETKEVPGVTKPEVMNSSLRTRVQIVKDKKAKSQKSTKDSKEKEEPKTDFSTFTVEEDMKKEEGETK